MRDRLMVGLMIEIVRHRLPDCQPADRQHADDNDDRENLHNTAIHHDGSHVCYRYITGEDANGLIDDLSRWAEATIRPTPPCRIRQADAVYYLGLSYSLRFRLF